MKESGIIEITKEQAKIIALVIAPDIRAYIDEHRTEYEAWLKEQDISEKQNHGNDNRRVKIIKEKRLAKIS